MDYNEDYRDFLDGFLTPMLREKYHIKSIEKTKVCFRGKGILVPYFEVYVRAILDKKMKLGIDSLVA